jgi:hypothetical protein
VVAGVFPDSVFKLQNFLFVFPALHGISSHALAGPSAAQLENAISALLRRPFYIYLSAYKKLMLFDAPM